MTFSGRLALSDPTSVSTAALIEPSVSGLLVLRADGGVLQEGFVLAKPASGAFSDDILNTVRLYHSYYSLYSSSDSLTIGEYRPAEAETLKNSSKLSATSVSLGESVTITASASGGTAPYTYGVYYKKTTSDTYTTAQAFRSNSKVTFKPGAAVKYDVVVKVKDAKGTLARKAFTVTVTS